MASQYHHLVVSDGREGFRIIRISSSARNESLTNEVLRLPFLGKSPKFAAACNELIWLYYSEDESVLWNPFTDECKNISLPNFEFPTCDYYRRHRTCTRSSYSKVFGLSFDAASGDCKLAKCTTITYSGKRDVHSVFKQIGVYSLKNNSWNEIPYNESYNMFGKDTLSLNGVSYWIATDHDHVVAFNLAKEEFSTFPIPDIILDSDTVTYLVEFDGSLAFVVFSWCGGAKCYRFWIMEVADGDVVWNRKDELDVCGVGVWNPLGFCKNGYSFLLQGRDGTLREYDYLTRKMKRIDEIFDYPLCMDLYSCIESTVKLDANDEQRKSKRKKKAEEGKGKSEWSLIPHKRNKRKR